MKTQNKSEFGRYSFKTSVKISSALGDLDIGKLGMHPSSRPLCLSSTMSGERKKDGYIVTLLLYALSSSPILRAFVRAPTVRVLDKIFGRKHKIPEVVNEFITGMINL